MQLDMPSFLDSHGRPALSCTEMVKKWVREWGQKEREGKELGRETAVRMEKQTNKR